MDDDDDDDGGGAAELAQEEEEGSETEEEDSSSGDSDDLQDSEVEDNDSDDLGGEAVALPIASLAEALLNRAPLLTIRGIIDRELRMNPDFLTKQVAAAFAGRLGSTTLHDAIFCNAHVTVVQFLVDKCPDALLIRRYGRELPLHLALLGNCGSDVINYLVDALPAAAKEHSAVGLLPLHLAIERARGNGGAPSSWSPLELVRILRSLIGVFPQALQERDEGGMLPLHTLLLCGDNRTGDGAATSLVAVTTIVEAFPEAQMARDRRGCLPIHLAARNPAPPLYVLQYLVRERPETLRARSHTGALPIHGAYGSPLDNLRFLAEEWPESLQEKDHKGYRPLHTAAYWGAPIATLEFWVERDPNAVLAKDHKGRIPLHAAAMGGRLAAVVEYLVQLRPESVHETDADGCLPLHVALGTASRRRTTSDPAAGLPAGVSSIAGVVRSLVQRHPEGLWTADHRGRLPIHHAAGRAVRYHDYAADLEALRLVLELGSNVLLEIQDNFGNLPLQAAMFSRAPLEKVQLLVQRYPDALRVRNAGGLLPVQVALSRRYPRMDVVRFLLERHPESVIVRDAKGRTLLHRALASMDPSMHRQNVGFVRDLVELWPHAVQIRDSKGLLPFHVAAMAVAAAEDGKLDVLYYLARLRPELMRLGAVAPDEGANDVAPVEPASRRRKKKARVP